MYIFARCLRSSAAVTPAKYELDTIQVTTVFIIRIKWENNGTDKIGLVTPTLGMVNTDLLVCNDYFSNLFPDEENRAKSK